MKKKNPIQIKTKSGEYRRTVWGGYWVDDPFEIDLNGGFQFDIENPFVRRSTSGFRICRTIKSDR